jgi:hypothetical protein
MEKMDSTIKMPNKESMKKLVLKRLDNGLIERKEKQNKKQILEEKIQLKKG